SLSRIATMPCEFRLRTWLPAIPVSTLLISQPAMSSASSIARCIDCTVDSMSTTTPRLSPRDGFDPKPITSSLSSADSSPTIATTFDVPMSRPTMSLRSSRLPTAKTSLHCAHPLPPIERHDGREIRRRPLAPADREAVRIAQVHVRDALQVGRERRRHDVEKSIHPLVDIAAAEPDLLPAAEHEPPRAALVELEALERQAGIGELAAHGEVAARDVALRAGRPRQARQLGERVLRALREELAAHVEQPRFS